MSIGRKLAGLALASGLFISLPTTALAVESSFPSTSPIYEQVTSIKTNATYQSEFSDNRIALPAHLSSDSDSEANNDSNLEIETRGVKSWIAKTALKSISGMIRSGGKQFIDLAGDLLDKETKTAIKNNSGTIADAIDDVAELPDLATHIVKEKLFYALSGPLGGGVANVIADAVAFVMNILL